MGKNLWFELRAFARRAILESDLHALDPNAFALLEWLVEQTQSRQDPIFMQQLVMDSKIASPATTFKCVAVLENAGLVSVTVDRQDARRRIIRPTRRALQVMEALSEKTEQWLAHRRRSSQEGRHS